MSADNILLIESFYGGSHKQLLDAVDKYFKQSGFLTTVITLPGKKWHWRARTSALYLSQTIPRNSNYKILFCSSVLNLAELLALRNDLINLKKIIYFHENQLIYPVRNEKERDFQYGYNEILSAMVADKIVFNSYFNKDSFLDNIERHLKLQADSKPDFVKEQIITKCQVIYFPIDLPEYKLEALKGNVLHIVWPHRWEHDKDPELFFNTLIQLINDNYVFKVSVLGESYAKVPDIFESSKKTLGEHVIQWGRLECKELYLECLRSAHVVVSTASHEFFGVAVAEAVSLGCFPIVPNKLSYPELYPKMCLYNTSKQLYKKLRMFCQKPHLCEIYFTKANINLNHITAASVMEKFYHLFYNLE